MSLRLLITKEQPSQTSRVVWWMVKSGPEFCSLALFFFSSDGGKVELWDLETGTSVRSVRGHDEDAFPKSITC